MKNLITILSLFIVLTGHTQTRVTKDAKGNYVVAKKDSASNKSTGSTITDKDGKIHPVYITAKGKLYYMRTSKNGNVYKCYIKVNVS